jgi:hypothetical protein
MELVTSTAASVIESVGYAVPKRLSEHMTLLHERTRPLSALRALIEQSDLPHILFEPQPVKAFFPTNLFVLHFERHACKL